MTRPTNGDIAKYSIGAVALGIIVFMSLLTNRFFDYIETHADRMATAVERNTQVINEFSAIIKNGYYKPVR